MPSTKQLLVPPAGLLAAFVLWRSLRRTPLSKVASSAQIGKLRSASQHNLVDAGSKASSAQQGNTNGTGNAGGGKKTTCVNATPNARQSQVSFMNTRSLIRLIWQTFNSRHFRGGLRRGVAVAVAFAMLTRWVLRKLGFSQEWSLVRLAITNLAVFWFFYYRRHIVEMPVLHFHRDFYHVSLVLRSKISQTPFRPVPWLADRHAQTVLGSVLNDLDNFRIFQVPITTRRVLLKSEIDGKHVNLDWYVSTEKKNSGLNGGKENSTSFRTGLEFSSAHRAAAKAAALAERQEEADRSPIIVLVHGIAGNSTEGYMCRLAHSFVQQGWRACSYDYWRFDFGNWQDMDVVVQHLRAKFPRAPIAAVGVSAGGHVLLRYLQATGVNCPLVAAVAISPCQDLIKETQRVRAEENPGYMYFLRYCVMTCAARHMAEGDWSDEENAAYEAVLRHTDKDTIEMIYDRFLSVFGNYSRPVEPEFEEVRKQAAAVRKKRLAALEACKDNGLSTADREKLMFSNELFEETADHYAGCAAHHMDKIAVTLLWIHARDDPIVAHKTVDWDNVHSNKNIITLTTERGGHVQWHGGLSPTGLTFADNATLEFLSSVLELQAQSRYFVDIVQRMFGTVHVGAFAGNVHGTPGTSHMRGHGSHSHRAQAPGTPQQVQNAAAQLHVPRFDPSAVVRDDTPTHGPDGDESAVSAYSSATSIASLTGLALSPQTTDGVVPSSSQELDVDPAAFARICSHSDLRAAVPAGKLESRAL